SAMHSRLGDLRDTTLDAAPVEFSTGDTVVVAFHGATTPGEGEDCVFRVRIPATAGSSIRKAGSRSAPLADLPKAFALLPPRPNPFRNSLTLRFDIPVPAEVRIEVFDVQGRHVADVVRGSLPAGHQVATWNGSLTSGGRAAAGVYLCRMTAGDFHAERTLVLLP